MKILAIEKDIEDANWGNAMEVLENEARYVYKFYLDGLIREIYFTRKHNAVIILECESKDAAFNLLNTLPLVQKGMIRFELIELLPYTGYDRILNAKQ
jgi:hypothetical protein